jgi:hypothetical protein
MAKTRINWAAGELLTSPKENEAIEDYVKAGHVWLNNAGQAVVHVDIADGGETIQATLYPVGVIPYNPAKSVFDTIRFAWYTRAGGAGAAVAPDVEYTLNAGTTWTALVDVLGFPVAGMNGLIRNTDAVSTTDSDSGMRDVTISGLPIPTWIGVRITGGTAITTGVANGAAYLSYFVKAALYNSAVDFSLF